VVEKVFIQVISKGSSPPAAGVEAAALGAAPADADGAAPEELGAGALEQAPSSESAMHSANTSVTDLVSLLRMMFLLHNSMVYLSGSAPRGGYGSGQYAHLLR
jgi:hypothetical protein